MLCSSVNNCNVGNVVYSRWDCDELMLVLEGWYWGYKRRGTLQFCVYWFPTLSLLAMSVLAGWARHSRWYWPTLLQLRHTIRLWSFWLVLEGKGFSLALRSSVISMKWVLNFDSREFKYLREENRRINWNFISSYLRRDFDWAAGTFDFWYTLQALSFGTKIPQIPSNYFPSFPCKSMRERERERHTQHWQNKAKIFWPVP